MRSAGKELRDLVALPLGACAALVFGVSLCGCNTTEGAGEDIEAAGEAIEEEAEDAN